MSNRWSEIIGTLFKKFMNYLKKQLTNTGILIITLIFLTVAFSVAASAQTNLEVFRTELAVPFDKVEGKILAVGETLVFIDDDKPEFSFAIGKNNIADLQKDDEVLTVQTKLAVRDRSGERTRFVFRLKDGKASDLVSKLNADFPSRIITTGETPKTNIATSKIYEVEHQHRFYGSCTGRLIIGDDRISFESTDDRDHSRQWLFTNIKKMKRNSPYKLEIKPFTGDSYTLDILGQGMDITDFKRLQDKLAAAKASR